MTTATSSQVQRDWAEILDRATTPQQFALLAQATTGADNAGHQRETNAWAAHAVDAYRLLIKHGCKQELNRRAATAEQAMDLLLIRDAGTHGLRADRLHGTIRAVFLRRGWITTTAPTGSATDWSAWLHLTPDGLAHALSACARPLQVSDALGMALHRVARYTIAEVWPGSDVTLRVAKQWDLVQVKPRTGVGNWYSLTDKGRAHLTEWQTAPRREVMPTAAQAALLGELIAGRGAPGTLRALHEAGTYDRCEAERWITYGEPDEYTRRPVHITDAGRDAHARFVAAPPSARPRPQRVTVGAVQAGQVVRLANRTGWRNLTAEWITVASTERLREPGGPGGYRVMMQTPNGPQQYTDQVFGYQTRFEIKP